MGLFSLEQYDKAIEALNEARKQLENNTQDLGCSVCGGDHHPDRCGFNPLYAQYLCSKISDQSKEMHDTLHLMTGYITYMGESVGVASVRKP